MTEACNFCVCAVTLLSIEAIWVCSDVFNSSGLAISPVKVTLVVPVEFTSIFSCPFLLLLTLGLISGLADKACLTLSQIPFQTSLALLPASTLGSSTDVPEVKAFLTEVHIFDQFSLAFSLASTLGSSTDVLEVKAFLIEVHSSLHR